MTEQDKKLLAVWGWINLMDMNQKYGQVIDVKAASGYFDSLGGQGKSQRLRAV